MRNSIDSEALAALEEVGPRNASLCSDTPSIIVGHGPAGNDATCEDPLVREDAAEQWGRRALATNGFGDVGNGNTASPARRAVYGHQSARGHRALLLSDIVVAAIRAAIALARRVNQRYEQGRQARAIYDALTQLDDRTLRDIGLDRSEIRSVAAELTGRAEYTRMQALRTAPNLPSVRRA